MCVRPTPHLFFLSEKDSVCLVPFSLAATQGITICFLFLPVLRCFNSRGMRSQRVASLRTSLRKCFTFRNREIKACVQLPRAYRSLPRLSSQSKPSHPSRSLSPPYYDVLIEHEFSNSVGKYLCRLHLFKVSMMMDPRGVEPLTSSALFPSIKTTEMQGRRSTIELQALQKVESVAF